MRNSILFEKYFKFQKITLDQVTYVLQNELQPSKFLKQTIRFQVPYVCEMNFQGPNKQISDFYDRLTLISIKKEVKSDI